MLSRELIALLMLLALLMPSLTSITNARELLALLMLNQEKEASARADRIRGRFPKRSVAPRKERCANKRRQR